jgi:hypothetical protein
LIAQLPLPVFGEDLQAERAKLLAELEAMEIKGRKFLPGSPKTKAKLAARGDRGRRIAFQIREGGRDRMIVDRSTQPSGTQGIARLELAHDQENQA